MLFGRQARLRISLTLRLQGHKGENIRYFDTFRIQEKRGTGKSNTLLVVYIRFVRYSPAQTAYWLCFLIFAERETLIAWVFRGTHLISSCPIRSFFRYMLLPPDMSIIPYRGGVLSFCLQAETAAVRGCFCGVSCMANIQSEKGSIILNTD